MLVVARHGTTLQFDDEGFLEPPYVYRPLLRNAVYEESFLEHIRDLGLVGQYLDIGAHLGTHTVWFAALCPSTHVHAFEPVRRYADVVRRNVVSNGLEDVVTVHGVGLSDQPGKAENYMSPEHQVGFSAAGVGVTETFDVVRLDDVVSGRVAVIKIDVEGMETRVLAGARHILSRYRPAVYAEAHSPEAAAEIGALLRPFGYRQNPTPYNASPTYEYLAPPKRGAERLRPLWNRLPLSVKRAIRRPR